MTSDTVAGSDSKAVGASGRVGVGATHSGAGAVGSKLTQLVRSTLQPRLCNRYTVYCNDGVLY